LSNPEPIFASSLLGVVPGSSISCFTHAPISRATRQIGDVDLDVVDATIFDLPKVAISASNNRDCMHTTPLQ
jgi:hypothetical protein